LTKDEALKLAEQSIKDLIYALAEGRITGDDYQPVELEAFSVLDAIKEALAQPVQEPVALPHRSGNWCIDLTCSKCYSAEFRFKHTSQQQRPWVGLTDTEVQAWLDENVNEEKNT
jgi:hypothetical protein